MLVLDAAAVEALLPMDACIDVMRDALVALARNDAVTPLRTVIRMPKGALAAMPAYDGTTGTVGLKIVTVFPHNPAAGLPSHLGVVLIFRAADGVVSAMIDAAAITAIRTAAASGLATRVLARPDAKVLAIIGTGVQAATHIEAMLAVRPLTRIRVFGRDPQRRSAFIARLGGRFDCELEEAESVEQAVRGADIVCTVTGAPTPVLAGAWVDPGAHINAVGASLKDTRELDASAVAMSRFYCDSRQSVLAESGDFLLARDEGAVDESHIVGELGDVLLGRVSGRTNAREITLFKSLGLGIEDVAAAEYVYRRAVEQRVGIEVPLGAGQTHA